MNLRSRMAQVLLMVIVAMATWGNAHAHAAVTASALPPDPGGGGTIMPPAGAIISAPSSGSTVLVGQSVPFIGTTISGTNFQWDFGDGTTSFLQNPTKTYSTAGTYTVRFTATDPDAKPSSNAITLNVAASTPPTIQSFVATPSTIAAGASTTLTWNVTGATSYSISNIGGVTGTSVTATPSSSITYTLTATNIAGSRTANVYVTVVPPPVVNYLSPSTTNPLYGATVTLTPSFSGGTGNIGSAGTGSSDIKSGAISGVGYSTTPITSTKTFTLTVTNSVGVTVPVNSPAVAPQTVSVSVSPSSGTRNTSSGTIAFSASVAGAANTTVTWACEHDEKSLEWNPDLQRNVYVINTVSDPIGADGVWTIPGLAATYRITATSVADPTKSSMASIIVVRPPTGSLSASNTAPLFGANVTVTPTFSGGTGVLGTSQGGSDLSTSLTTGTGVSVGPITSTKTYWMRVTNTAGAYIDTSVVVAPQTVVVAPISPTSPTLTVNTAGAIFNSSVTGAVNTAITWSVSAGTITAGQGTNSMTWTAPATPQPVTITAVGVSGTPASTTVNVVAAPIANYLSPSMTNPLYGASVTLTPSFSNGTANIGTVNVGNSDIRTGATNGVGYSTPAITSPKTYILTVTNAAGTVATVPSPTVTPQTVSVSVSPGSSTRTASSGSITFLASVAGAANTGITWTCEHDERAYEYDPILGRSVPVINTVSDPIGANGVWAIPSLSATYRISATSVADLTKSNTATVVVVAPPTGSIVSSGSPLYGANAIVTPTFSGGAAVLGTSQGGSDISTSPTTGSGISVGPITSTRTYWLRVTNAAGTYVDSSVEVTPQTVVVAPITPASPTKTVNTAGVTFTSSVSGAMNTAITWGVSAGTITAGQGTNSMTWTAPATPQPVTITATGVSGTPASTTVNVVAAPIANYLSPSMTNPLYGASVTLTPSFSNGTADIGTVDVGNSDIRTGATDGVGYSTPAITSPKTYILTVTNAAGTAVTVKSPTVTPQAVVISPIFPASSNQTVNAAGVTFTATVSGAVNTGVTWTLSAGGGTITGGQGTNSITWTAPPTPQTVTITATPIAGGDPVSTPIYVVALPVATRLVASTTNPLNGGTINLTPTFSGGTAVIGSGGIGTGDVTSAAVSGTAYQSAPITKETTFTLTVTNAAGTKVSVPSDKITPQVVSIGPGSNFTGGYLRRGTEAATVSASVTGSTNTNVIWSATGGGGTFTPSVTASGANSVWTPPNTLGPFDLTASAQADASQKVTRTYTVIDLPAKPVITTPSKVNAGQQGYSASVPAQAGCTYSWSVANATIVGATSTPSISFVAGGGPSTTLTCTVTNALGDPASDSVAVTVNRAPTLGGLPVPQLRVNDYVVVSLPAGADADGDNLVHSVTGLPPGLSFDPDSMEVSGTPTLAGSYAVAESVQDPMTLSAGSHATWVVEDAGGSTEAPTPSLPADDSVFQNAKFTEVLGYAGSDTGLITSVQVNRQLQEGMASLASGKDRATQSTYQYGYDPLGQLVVANGTWVDANGQPVTYVDPNTGLTQASFTDNTIYRYDAHGNRTFHTPAGKGEWAYSYKPNTNQLVSAGPRTFTYTPDGAVKTLTRTEGSLSESQTLTYSDPRFMRLPTQMIRTTADGRVVTTDAMYDMSGTRVYKRDQVWQGTGTSDKSKLVSDRETIYLANGTEVLMEVEQRGAGGVVAPQRYSAYIFGAGNRLARLSWDADGRVATEASPQVGLANATFATATNGVPDGWSAVGQVGVYTDGTLGQVLKLTKSASTYAEQPLGNFAAGDVLEIRTQIRGDGAGGAGQVALAGAVNAAGVSVSAITWQPVVFRQTMAGAGALSLRLQASGTEGLQAYVGPVSVRKLLPATVATGKINYWPDPGFESVLGHGGGVSSGNATIAEASDGARREGLHVLTLAAGGSYSRVVSNLDPAKQYLFSVWKNLGNGWTREIRSSLAPNSNGTLTISLNETGSYDQAELIEDTGQVVESWIPENRLGRVDWFITDHLGSTKLLIDQNGQHRFTGDDDPFGINLRSFGDKDTHRYTGQILDEEQWVYYYGARYYLPEIGRFLSADPKLENHSKYSYAANMPIFAVDRNGEDWYLFYWKGTYGHTAIGVDAPKMVQEAYAKSNRGTDDSQIRIAGKWPAWAYSNKDGLNEAVFGSGVTGKIIGTKDTTTSLNSLLYLPNKPITGEDVPPDVVIRIKTAFPQRETELFKWIGEQVGSKTMYKGSLGACTDFVAEGARIMGTVTPTTTQADISIFLPMQTIRTPRDIFLDIMRGANLQKDEPKQMEVIKGSINQVDPPKL